jgi:hypothetical protein
MILFAALIIPIITAILLWKFYRHRTVWWEFAIPFGASLIIALLFKFGGELLQTRDVEYWSGIIVKTEYYQDWNEYIHRTCTRSCGEDCTTTYDCSYVQYHSAYWQITDNNGITIRVSQAVYNKLKKKYGNSDFVDLRRNYHTNDGDKYVSSWPRTDATIECMVTEHYYENRIQASHDVFNYPEVTPHEQKKYGLYKYPEIKGYYKQKNLLGVIDNKKHLNHKLEILNAKLGHKKEVKVFVLIFRDQLREAGIKQEALWVGGNKNEFVVCIGLDDDNNVEWCHPFSWTDANICQVDVRTHIEESDGTIDMEETIDFIYQEMDSNFKRKHFTDFDYLAIPVTGWQLFWTFLVTIIINVVLSVWLIINEFEEKQNYSNKWYVGSSYKRNIRLVELTDNLKEWLHYLNPIRLFKK